MKKMKLLLVLLAVAVVSMSAQELIEPPVESQEFNRANYQTQELKLLLDLDEKQAAEIMKINESTSEQLKAHREEVKEQREANKAQMQTKREEGAKLREAQQGEIMQVLNEEQQAKYQEWLALKKEKQEAMKAQRQKGKQHKGHPHGCNH